VTKSESAEIVRMLIAAYPHTKFVDVVRSSTVYQAGLADLDREVCHRAVVRLIGTAKFLPTIAEIREACVTENHGLRRPAGDAWGDVVAAMKRYGAKRYDLDWKGPVFDDLLVARCVKAFSWVDLCSSENTVADRARFIQLYEQYAQNERTAAQVDVGATNPVLPRGLGPISIGDATAKLLPPDSGTETDRRDP